MLVKVNSTIKNKVKVTQLDIDDYGYTVIPLKDLELNIPADDLVIQTLKNSSYAVILLRAIFRRIAVLSFWPVE